MTDETAQIRDYALSVLRDALAWSLRPTRWEDVEGILAMLGDRLNLADPKQLTTLHQATVTLELAGPVRITIVDKAAVSVPDKVRERVNHLIHELERPENAADLDDDSGTTQ